MAHTSESCARAESVQASRAPKALLGFLCAAGIGLRRRWRGDTIQAIGGPVAVMEQPCKIEAVYRDTAHVFAKAIVP